jgi:hypothetical protein
MTTNGEILMQTQSERPSLPAVPTTRDMISSSLTAEGQYPKTRYVCVFEYPDCRREFDGTTWRVVEDYRK